MNEHKEVAIQALKQMRGDDLYRARKAFRTCTPEMMAEKYGESYQTRAQILAGYEAHERKVDAAIAWLQAQ